jgi:hypothetical protein
MVGTESPTLFAGAVAELAARGVQLAARPGEYVVNFRGGTQATAYVTDDLADAIEHGRALAASIVRADPPAASREPTRGKPRRRPLRMTPKAVNKRRRLAHLRKMRARAIRQEKKE